MAVGRKSVLLEADSLVHGDRNAAYGHPLDDMDRTAGMVSAMLAHKLLIPLTAEDVALIMCQVKISRQINKPKRDNAVDLAGYAECLDWIIEERAMRTAGPSLLTSRPEPGPVVPLVPVVTPLIKPLEDEPE